MRALHATAVVGFVAPLSPARSELFVKFFWVLSSLGKSAQNMAGGKARVWPGFSRMLHDERQKRGKGRHAIKARQISESLIRGFGSLTS